MFIHFHTFSMLWGEIFISADDAGGGMAGLLFLVGFGVCDMITNEKKRPFEHEFCQINAIKMQNK